MEFSNPIVGLEELIRSAIKSQDYQAGTSGWRIAADGSAEFTDLILSFLTSNSRLEITNGEIRLYDFNNQLVVFIDRNGLYSIRANPSNVTTNINYVGLTDSSVEFNNYVVPNDVTVPGSINWETSDIGGSAGPDDPVNLIISSGFVRGFGNVDGCQVTLSSVTDASVTKPKMRVDGDGAGAGFGADLEVTGDITGADLNAWQTYTPTWSGISNQGTSPVRSGRWCRVKDTVHFVAAITAGTGSPSLGTGSVTVTLPVTASSAPASNLGWQGTGRHFPNDGSSWKTLFPYIAPGGTSATVFGIRQSDLAWVSPGTAGNIWIAGSQMRVQGQYEVA
jgi:hypothetical protein